MKLSGFSLILIATAVSGIASYVVTWLVPRQVGFAHYAPFAVFWSFLYLVVGTLSGIQQEVTRATAPVSTASGQAHRARNFAVVAGLVVFVLVIATAPAWAQSTFADAEWSLVWPLAVGTSSYVFVAVLAGSLYGLSRWLPLAMMMTTDAILRLAAVSIVLIFTKDVVALAWAVALPFPGAILLLWLFIRRSVAGRTAMDVGYGALTWNVARTIVAAASMSAMVSGFPFLLSVTSAGQPPALVGLFILSITLTRAPLIVVTMSLQSYFVVTFRSRATRFRREFLKLQAIVAVAGVVFAALGWAIGPAVFGILFPGQALPDGWFIAVLVASSALVGALCISAPAVLARSQHLVYSAGWVLAAMVTIIALLLPFDFTTRTVISLLVGPAVGLVVHAIYLTRAHRADRKESQIPVAT